MLTKQRFTKVNEKWYVIEPLFFAVWTTHELSINPNIKTIRVGQGKIEYNPTFIEALDDKTLEQVLQFEVMRIILKHPYLRRKENKTVAYAASNITVQEYQKTSLDFPTAKQVFKTDEYDNKYFEFYYSKLLEQMEKEGSTPGQSAQGGFGQQQGNSSQQGNGEQKAGGGGKDDSQEQVPEDNGGGGKDDSQEQVHEDNGGGGKDDSQEQVPEDNYGGGKAGSQPRKKQSPSARSNGSAQSNGIDQYTDPESSGMQNTELWDANEYYTNQINDKIESALENNSWGTVPSRIQELILATLKPKINYREVLKSFRASILSVNRVLTRMKPSRRYGFLYMGSRRDFCTKLLFAIDVSGSVDSYDIRKAFSVINQLFKYGIEQVDVLQFDAEVKGKPLSLKKAKYKVKVIGRGGTDFQPVVDYIDANKDYDGLIIFTDGWAPVPTAPKNKRTRVLWLFNNEDNYMNMKDNLRLIGRSTFIKAS
jgi:predicted metal-dependent peptidase